jgi:hypothetical protein
VTLPVEVPQWQDVRLHLLDEKLEQRPGKIYGKVTETTPGDNGRLRAEIRFTSVSPELFQVIRQAG